MELRQHPRLGALKRLWNMIDIGVDRADVTLHADMGRPRDAGAVAAMLMPFVFLGATDAAAAPVLAPVLEPAVEPPPPAPPQKPDPDKGGR
jgi:hypothetical protein